MNFLTSNIEKQLLNALEGAKEYSRKAQLKQELKNWRDISVPVTLKDALTRLTKDELSDIRKQLDIKGASQFKKGELIDLLQAQIPDSLEMISWTMDQERYNIVKNILGNGGVITEPKLADHQIEYFRSYGILFTGTYQSKKIIVMPEEIVKKFLFQEDNLEIKRIYRRNSEWIKLTQGLLYYYGTLNIEELLNLLKKYRNEEIDVSKYLSVMECARKYYRQINIEVTGFSNFRVFDPEKVKREHNTRNELDFYPFSKEQLLKAGEPDFVERNDHYHSFVDFLTQNYEIGKQDADVLVEECGHAIRLGESPNSIIKFLETRLEFESLDILTACMEKVMKFTNNTRQWFIKGYTPEELSPREQKSLLPLTSGKQTNANLKRTKKVGRNAPCPCGSTKKFKHCCGR